MTCRERNVLRKTVLKKLNEKNKMKEIKILPEYFEKVIETFQN